MLREFILGHNQTGLVANSSGKISVVGGENATLAQPILSGQAGIYVGSGTTQSTYTYPSATIAAWDSFIATSAPTAPGAGSGTSNGTSSSTVANQGQHNGASYLHVHWLIPLASLLLVILT